MKSKNNYPWFIVILLLSINCSIAQDKWELISIQFDKDKTQTLTQNIIGYQFENDKITSIKTYMSVDGLAPSGKDYIRLDIGKLFIYKNKYLVSNKGYIIDFNNKKIISDQKSTLVRYNSDSIIFYTNDIFKGKYYSVFLVADGKLHEIKNPAFQPAKTADIEFEKQNGNLKLCYYPTNKPKIIISNNAGSILPNKMNTPIYFLDFSQLLYLKNTATNNHLTINKTDINLKIEKDICELDFPMSNLKDARFEKTEQSLYLILNNFEKVQIIENYASCKEVQKIPLNTNFAIDIAPSTKKKKIYFNDAEVGAQYCNIAQVTQVNNKIALVKEIMLGSEVYQEGIAVWTESAKKWFTFEADNIVSLAGFIDKSSN